MQKWTLLQWLWQRRLVKAVNKKGSSLQVRKNDKGQYSDFGGEENEESEESEDNIKGCSEVLIMR